MNLMHKGLNRHGLMREAGMYEATMSGVGERVRSGRTPYTVRFMNNAGKKNHGQKEA